MEEVDELREAMREAETRGAFEEPEQSIEFDAHIINPSEYVEKIAPTATREIVLANLGLYWPTSNREIDARPSGRSTICLRLHISYECMLRGLD